MKRCKQSKKELALMASFFTENKSTLNSCFTEIPAKAGIFFCKALSLLIQKPLPE